MTGIIKRGTRVVRDRDPECEMTATGFFYRSGYGVKVECEHYEKDQHGGRWRNHWVPLSRLRTVQP